MDDIEIFLQHHRAKLLRYLDGKAPESPGDPGPLEYIDQVLNEWSKSFDGHKLESPSPEERTFWFALYQLEELVENPPHQHLEPYEGVLMAQLALVRELLRDWRGLPEKYYATRPGEDLAFDESESGDDPPADPSPSH